MQRVAQGQAVAFITSVWPGLSRWEQQGQLIQALVKLWARHTTSVTVLLVMPVPPDHLAKLQSGYPQLTWVCLHDFWHPPNRLQFGGEHRSQAIFEWLRHRSFGEIFFGDHPSDGFIAIQAKQTGLAFAETTLNVLLSGPECWQREQNLSWPTDPYQALKNDFTTRYCCEKADRLYSLDPSVLHWCRLVGWSLAPVIERDYPAPKPAATHPSVATTGLIFCGSLAPGHGLALLLQTLRQLFKSEPWPELRTLILREHVATPPPQMLASTKLIGAFEAEFPHLHLELKLDPPVGDGAPLSDFAVMMSTQYRQMPYEVVHFLSLGCPVLLSRNIPHQSWDTLLKWQFDKNPTSLQKALSSLRSLPLVPTSHHHQQQQVNRSWSSGPPSHSRPITGTPLVSVCIPFYNHGAYLPALLDSLAANIYPHFEVIVVNDGSTDPESLKTFTAESTRFGHYPWQFLSKPNSGPGATRNFAAEQAQGDYLLFMDADNVARPEMISLFAQGMLTAGADILTCHFGGFKTPSPVPNQEPELPYRPLGPCLELALLENVLGDSNLCIKRSVFESLGGFVTDNQTSCEDWELLVNALMQGYRLDVIPQILFWYRILPQSRSRTHSLYYSHRRIMECYVKNLPTYLQRLIQTLAVPLFREFKVNLWPTLRQQQVEIQQLRQLLAQQEAQLRRYRARP